MRFIIRSALPSLLIIVIIGSWSAPTATAQGLTVSSQVPRFVNLGVSVDPQITEEPAREVVIPGGEAQFEITVHGTDPIQYQWWHDGNPIPGATQDTLTVPAVSSPADEGDYWCVANNPLGAVESVHVPLEIHDPGIVRHPEGYSGAFAHYVHCEAVGTAPISYQWMRNGIDIPEATDWGLGLDPDPMINGEYVCKVTGAGGTILSNPASVHFGDYSEFVLTTLVPGHLSMSGSAPNASLVAVVGGLRPVYTMAGDQGPGMYQLDVPLKAECTNYLSVVALDSTKGIVSSIDLQITVDDDLPSALDNNLVDLTIAPASPKGGGAKADVIVDATEAKQFVCTGHFQAGASIIFDYFADITPYVTWSTTQDAIVESGGLYVNTGPGPDAVIQAMSGTTISNTLTVADGTGSWSKGATANTIMGSVKDGSRSPKPPIGGATVGIYASPSSGSPVATITTNSYGNYNRYHDLGIWCLKGSKGTHQLVTASNQSNQTTTLKGYFALWPTGTSIPPTAVLFSNSVIAKKSGSGKAGDPILLDENQVDIGAIASSPFADLTGVTLSVDGPGGYHTEIDILAEGSITTVLEPGDGTGEPGERGDYFADPNAMVRKPGGVYRGLHFLPAAGTYDFELAVTDSNGILATDNLIVERAADPEDEMPLAAWPLLPVLLALSAAAIAKKYPRR